MYKRLVQQKSTVCNKKLEQERSKNLSVLKRMGRYPYKASNLTTTIYESEDKID
jgi:hypothetical protein